MSVNQRSEISHSHTSSPSRQHQMSPAHASVSATVSSVHQSPVYQTASSSLQPVAAVAPVFSSSSPTRHRSSLTPAAATVIQDPASCPIIPGHETTIEINKGKSGLGLSIVGGSDTLLGAVIVHEVYDNGAAAKDGRLLPGDQILEVCGETLEGVTHENAIRTLRQTPPVIRLVVLRDEPGSDDNAYDVVTAELVKKPGHGLGFSIVTHQNGVFISDIVKGSVVDNDGRLKPADQIIGFNGQELLTATREYIAELLKTAGGMVSITVRRLKSVPSSAHPGRPHSDDGSRSNELHTASSKPESASKRSGLSTDNMVPDDDILVTSHL